jgi:hypothetical protein
VDKKGALLKNRELDLFSVVVIPGERSRKAKAAG